MAALHALALLLTGLLLRNSASAAEGPATSGGGGGGGGGGGAGDWDMFSSGLQVMYNAYQSCEKGPDDLVSCLKLRALRSAERALRQDKVPLLGGLSFVKQEQGEDGERAGRRLADAPPQMDEAALPLDRAGRQRALDELLLDRLGRFFRGHTLQMDTARLLDGEGDAADEAEDGQGEDGAPEEGRGRKKGLKKYGGALLLGLMMKGGLMAMAWKGVALMAGKALMVAKIALVLSAVVALKKLSGGGGHGDEKVTYEIVKHPQVSHSQTFSTGHDYGGHFDSSGGGGGGGGGGGHYKRSLDPLQEPSHAHTLAYSAHAHPLPHAHYHIVPVPVRAPYPHTRLQHYHYPSPQQMQQQQVQQQFQQQQQQQLQQQTQQTQQDYQYEVVDQTQEEEDEENQPVYPYPQQ